MRRSKRSGFTLIELMVVVAILAILAVMAGPSFSSFMAQRRLKGAAEELMGDLQYARSESVQRNATMTVTFSTTGYEIKQGATSVKTVSLADGNAWGSGSSMSVTYEPVRATATVANGPVVLGNSGTSGSLQVTVNAMGRVEICSPSGSMKGYSSC